jgi:hypothetical protein
MGMRIIQTVETRLEIQYIVFITIVDDTMGLRRGRWPLALSVWPWMAVAMRTMIQRKNQKPELPKEAKA